MRTRTILASTILALSFVVGCTQLYWHNFVDEGLDIALGDLIARGFVLYRDLFTHHFPLPAHWIALVIWLCGPSILPIRLSLLLFQTGCFALVVWLTPFRLAAAIAALVWRAIAPMYFGNLVIYHALAGPALTTFVWITMALVGGSVAVRRRHLVALGVSASVAILSNPLSVYPVLLGLVASGVGALGFRRVASVGLVMALLPLAYGMYLLGSGALTAFVADALRFNTEVYGKYAVIHPAPFATIVRVAATGLGIFDRRWPTLDPLAPLGVDQNPDDWVFTGVFFRAAVMLASFVLVLHRRDALAFLLYAFAAVLIATRGSERFYAIPFIGVALVAAALVVTGEWREREPPSGTPRVPRDGPRRALPPILETAPRVAVALALAWLGVRGIATVIEHRDALSYTANFATYETRGAALRALACDRADAVLAYYPYDPLIHFFSRMPPVAGYVFMTPWVADVGLVDVLARLDAEEALVYVDPAGEVWNRTTRDYLAPLTDVLAQRHVPLGRGLYASSALARACRPEEPAGAVRR